MASPKQIIKAYLRMAARGRNLMPVNKIIGRLIVSSVQRNFREGGRPKRWKKSGGAKKFNRKTLIQSGELMRDINFHATRSKVTVGTSKKYAPLQHFGEPNLTPKTAQFLTVPIGLTQFEIRQGITAREFDNTFIANYIIFQKIGKKIRPLFKLEKSVSIPARKFLVVQTVDRETTMVILDKWIMGGYKTPTSKRVFHVGRGLKPG